MNIDFLRQFWTWVYLLGLGGFACIAVVLIPLGFRDLLQLLRELGEDEADTDAEHLR